MASFSLRSWILLLLIVNNVTAFVPVVVVSKLSTTKPVVIMSPPPFMFSGAGDGAIKEDMDPEQIKAIEEAAKAMGMTVDEYQLGMNARLRFETAIGELRYKGGNDDIGLEVDGRSPPNHLVITITDAGKAKGKDAISQTLAEAFKTTSKSAQSGRQAAQNEMMKFIQEAMK